MTKIVSLDIGGTLYGHNSIKTPLGQMNACDEFALNMSGVSMLQIVDLMKKGKFILINSFMQDGEMLKKILNDINYFYNNSLSADVNHDKRELQQLFESKFFISSFGGRKIARLQLVCDAFVCVTVSENTVDCNDLLGVLKRFHIIESKIKILGVHFKYGNEEKVVNVGSICKMQNAHIALLGLECATDKDAQKLISYINYATRGQYEATMDDGSVLVGRKAGKDVAISKLCKILNVEEADVVHFGDSPTDVLENVDCVIVKSKNSLNHVKSVNSSIEAELMRLN